LELRIVYKILGHVKVYGLKPHIIQRYVRMDNIKMDTKKRFVLVLGFYIPNIILKTLLYDFSSHMFVIW
jgi:hypothetical protein